MFYTFRSIHLTDDDRFDGKCTNEKFNEKKLFTIKYTFQIETVVAGRKFELEQSRLRVQLLINE